MTAVITYLQEFNLISILVRLVLAIFFGGLIGMERGSKGRAAGLRTYLIVCLGAALTMLLGQYNDALLKLVAGTAGELYTDVSRFGAQVINGVGFLGAGTIIITGHRQVKGLTTAAGLWASACMGLAVGAGFYECVFPAFVCIAFSMRVLPMLEGYIIENARDMSIYAEFESMDDIGKVLMQLKRQDLQIYGVEVDRDGKDGSSRPSAVISARLSRRRHHEQVLADISELEGIHMVEEL